MEYWWQARSSGNSWVEIRRVPGIGTGLLTRAVDRGGRRYSWYQLVSFVRKGDVIYHYDASEQRFVGHSVAAADARTVEDKNALWHEVELSDFALFEAPIELSTTRERADAIYALRDQLEATIDGPLYLPFQFRADRTELRMVSNYFATMPEELATLIFGANVRSLAARGAGNRRVQTRRGSFLQPFRPKADTEYMAFVAGGQRERTRAHETLVNRCAAWLASQGYEPRYNVAIDIGLDRPHVIIEAKIITGSIPSVVREAVGQLYEHRYFGVARPRASLIFLADQAIPDDWIGYLEHDRRIGVMWPRGNGFYLSALAKRSLRL